MSILNRRAERPLLALLVVFVLALAMDGWVYRHFLHPDVYGAGWARLLRLAGYFPLWVVVAIGLVLQDWAPRTVGSLRDALRRGSLLFWSTALGGGAAELLKILIRRERPNAHDGAWAFRPWSEHPLSTAKLGLPSSEAAVAFAAAAMLARLFPRTGGLWYLVAVGCALTRVAAGAHFLSDVVLAALTGYAASAWLWRRRVRDDTPPEAPATRPA